ncbi:MAG: tRNA (adenosine(37)-N6)-threonylcarbamoyltransferase complex ATPase subunit type 1 TsaE [Bacilli bacterium]|nr:tRNA (adenosine(37)-N6)-threonylcarbamoyltransferase complex ATPase subunit type 1 TsaE [Bacilli bacterium]
MEEYKITIRDEEDLIELAQNIESEKFPNMVICLNGELGSGKTVFAKAFASAMGIDEVSSPTFSIIKEYVGELPFYHMDVYRVENNVENLGIEEYFTKGGVTIIEWADMIKEYLPKERLDIKIKVTGENTRLVILTPHGEEYNSVCEAVI